MRYWILIIMCILSACNANEGNSEIIDYEVEIQAYSTEAASIRDEMVISRTEIAATVIAAEAQSNEFSRYNAILRQTTVAIFPIATDARIVANDIEGPLPAEVYDLSDGAMRFVQIGPAGQVDEQGCFRSKQQFFRLSDGVIFMTAVALNLRAGTSVRADWQFGGELVYSNSWVAPQSEQYRCIVLAMRPSDTDFLMGNWSVTLSINGQSTEARSFTILDG